MAMQKVLDERQRPRALAVAAFAAMIFFPIIPWLLAGPVVERFTGANALHSIANLAAFLAISAWTATLILASRIGPVERALGGLEHLYSLHRRIGALVVVLAVTHVAFLTLHAGNDALQLYLPSAGWSRFSGVVAVVLLLGLVLATIVNRLSYQRFVLVQDLLGSTFAIGAYHSYAVRGTAAASSGLTTYLLLLTAVGLACLGYRMIGTRLGLGHHRYKVEGVRHLDADVIEITMTPTDRGLTFRAGQFVYASFRQPGLPFESHPFTIASAPGDHIRLVVKRLGDFTAALQQLRPGATALVEGPFGNFDLRQDQRHAQTWIAGGIGITPFLSWARSLDDSTASDLFYCTEGADSAHFLDELFEIAERHPRLRVISIRKDSLGYLSVDDLAAVNPHLAEGDIFICGPQTMIKSLRTGLDRQGIDDGRVHTENFDFR